MSKFREAAKYHAVKVATGTVLLVSSVGAFADDFTTATTAVQTEVLSKVGIAVTAGFAIMTVVLGASIGFGLLSKFINKGAQG